MRRMMNALSALNVIKVVSIDLVCPICDDDNVRLILICGSCGNMEIEHVDNLLMEALNE